VTVAEVARRVREVATEAPNAPRRTTVELSARNQLKGTVTNVRTDGLMAEVTVDIGWQEITSVITRASAERLNLQPGDAVTVVIKSTEVMLGK
jgi:molybdopterin-binding protein